MTRIIFGYDSERNRRGFGGNAPGAQERERRLGREDSEDSDGVVVDVVRASEGTVRYTFSDELYAVRYPSQASKSCALAVALLQVIPRLGHLDSFSF